jgi:hypothetical protein
MPLHNGGVQIRPLLLADALGAPMNAREFDGQAELASAAFSIFRISSRFARGLPLVRCRCAPLHLLVVTDSELACSGCESSLASQLDQLAFGRVTSQSPQHCLPLTVSDPTRNCVRSIVERTMHVGETVWRREKQNRFLSR